MYCGYYDDLEKEDGWTFYFLQDIQNKEGFPAYDFLHGGCINFALALSEEFGYKIETIKNPAGALIHAYCVNEDPACFVDIRGITDNPLLFYQPFQDVVSWDGDGGLWCYPGEAIVGRFETAADFKEKNKFDTVLLAHAHSFLQLNPSFYNITDPYVQFLFKKGDREDVAPLITKNAIDVMLLGKPWLSVEEQTATELYLWDDRRDKEIPIYYLENTTPETLAHRIHISDAIPEAFRPNPQVLSEYLWLSFDKNAFLTMESISIVWSEPDNPETFEPSDFEDPELKRLAEEYGDEYPYYILDDNLVVVMWNERNTCIVDAGKIARAVTASVEKEEKEGYYRNLFSDYITEFLATTLHELRHLEMDTNPFLPPAYYPSYLGKETSVEEYAREVIFDSMIPYDLLSSFKLKPTIDTQIEDAASRTKQGTVIVNDKHIDRE